MTRRIVRVAVLSLVLTGLAGWAPPIWAGKYAEKAEVAEKRVAPEEGKALVYMLRTARTGAAIYVWTFADKELLGVTRGRAYAVANVDPGAYLLWSKAENVSAEKVEFEAGKTYYVQQLILPGFGKARTRVEMLNEAEGLKALGRIKKRSETTAEGQAKAVEIAERLWEKAQEKAAKDDD